MKGMKKMNKFMFELDGMEELESVDSAWFFLFGSGFVLVCA